MERHHWDREVDLLTNERKQTTARQHLHTILPAAVVAIASTLSADSAIANDSFLNFEGVDSLNGSAGAEGFRDQIVIVSWSWGVQNLRDLGDTNSTGGNSQPQFSSVLFSKQVDRATAGIYQNLAVGTVFKEVILTTIQPRTHPDEDIIRNLEVTLSDVVINSASTGGSIELDGATPVESFSLTPSKVSMVFFRRNPNTGNEERLKDDFCWDIANNSRC